MNAQQPMNRLRQVFAIARTEFIFGYRRPGPAFLALISSLAVALGAVISCIDSIPDKAECLEIFGEALADPVLVEQMILAGNPPATAEEICSIMMVEWYEENANASIARGIEQSWFPFLLFSLVFVSAAAAQAIPADRQYGASEWLRAMPIDGNIYLLGKILGMFSSALAGSLIPVIIFIPVTLVLTHTLPVGLMTALTLLDGLPVLLWSTSFGVMAGIPFRKRINAAVMSLFLGFCCLVAWLSVFHTPYGSGTTIDTAAYYAIQQFGYQPGISWQVEIWQVLGMYLALLIAGILLWLVARRWLWRKENI
jgi:hypothetical protein